MNPKAFASTYHVRHVGDRASWAIFSHDDRYRYALGRVWDLEPIDPEVDAVRPLMTWVMLNPSVADHAQDDPTIRKCVGFAKRHGCSGIVVVNLFAWRATDPRELARAPEPLGPLNLNAIVAALRVPFQFAIAAWGRMPSKRIARAANASQFTAKTTRLLSCFGTTAGGEPRHPLMLPYATKLRAPGRWDDE